MNGYKLGRRGRAVRLVSLVAGEHEVAEEPSDWIPLAVIPPQTPKSSGDGSPRENAARHRLIYTASEPELSVAGRVEVFGGETYELLTNPRPLRLGTNAVGFEVEALPVGILYPHEAEFEGLSSAAAVPLSLYTGSEGVADHGDYDTYDAEAPVEFADQIGSNTVLLLGERRLRVVESVLVYEIPHVRLRLRAS